MKTRISLTLVAFLTLVTDDVMAQAAALADDVAAVLASRSALAAAQGSAVTGKLVGVVDGVSAGIAIGISAAGASPVGRADSGYGLLGISSSGSSGLDAFPGIPEPEDGCWESPLNRSARALASAAESRGIGGNRCLPTLDQDAAYLVVYLQRVGLEALGTDRLGPQNVQAVATAIVEALEQRLGVRNGKERIVALFERGCDVFSQTISDAVASLPPRN